MKITYIYGSFTDYLGRHEITICGITQEVKNQLDNSYRYKSLNIGISIQNPFDKYDKEKGDKIALGRAKSTKKAIRMVSNYSGMFNTNTVKVLLENLLGYIINDPGEFIRGYNEVKKSYERKKSNIKFFESLDEEQIKELRILAELNYDDIDNAKQILKDVGE